MAGFAAANGLGVAAEPVRETRRTETWIVAGREALVVHCYTVIERLGILSVLVKLARPIIHANKIEA